MSHTTADHRRPALVRRAAVSVAGAAALATVAGAYSPSHAYAEPTAADQPLTDFSDCPALPAGADPARWRCEVHTAAPLLTMGKVTVTLAPIAMTHAEGPLPDGTNGQVWGAMHSTPTAVAGGFPAAVGEHERLWGLAIQPEYGGRSDFYTGRFSLRFRLLSPLLAPNCTIGANAPIDFQLKRSGPSQWVSQDPPLIKFSAYDDTFSAPAAEHCGPLAKVLNQRLGLPAASGNLMTYDAAYTFKTYDQLPAR
ncbi:MULTISPECIES: hypothetical protein [Streptomyces]|uniref:hypothetical protein n=1 Tax=Streptomyces herbicida TaxID=3065675 RepID=UPI00293127AE|nr:hypothetical protein [Streptomyces sp. NEAU-HV9]